jgi:hypothetical protein
MSASTGPTSTSIHQPQTFNISCTTCRQRKVKCTRVYPCLPCKQSGFECVFLQRRQPRRDGRRRKQVDVAALAERLNSVEALLQRIRKGSLPIATAQWNGSEIVTANATTTSNNADLSQVLDIEQKGCAGQNLKEDQNQTSKSLEIEAQGDCYEMCPFWTSLTDEVRYFPRLITGPTYLLPCGILMRLDWRHA